MSDGETTEAMVWRRAFGKASLLLIITWTGIITAWIVRALG